MSPKLRAYLDKRLAQLDSDIYRRRHGGTEIATGYSQTEYIAQRDELLKLKAEMARHPAVKEAAK